ncbi:hypothetical protein GCK72_001562 [Caenorhabditis remanei]|uniref:Uncharacterized protein n=1 Tax=Caenorhabditis remanei TaxID=31234 RepID=A0A6A5HQ20_CAERE|nr:hypothetical protein GCK72_001562 [Caenorhabditis remanei]KAF1769745.1 hypothetical protein GCK72_001562 [Caenorhabditis remanei]
MDLLFLNVLLPLVSEILYNLVENLLDELELVVTSLASQLRSRSIAEGGETWLDGVSSDALAGGDGDERDGGDDDEKTHVLVSGDPENWDNLIGRELNETQNLGSELWDLTF